MYTLYSHDSIRYICTAMMPSDLIRVLKRIFLRTVIACMSCNFKLVAEYIRQILNENKLSSFTDSSWYLLCRIAFSFSDKSLNCKKCLRLVQSRAKSFDFIVVKFHYSHWLSIVHLKRIFISIHLRRFDLNISAKCVENLEWKVYT